MMKLDQAEKIAQAARNHARANNFKPMAFAVLDSRGVVRCLLNEDGTSLHRAEVAIGKAYGAISLGISSRKLGERAEKQAYFIAAAAQAAGLSQWGMAGAACIKVLAGVGTIRLEGGEIPSVVLQLGREVLAEACTFFHHGDQG